MGRTGYTKSYKYLACTQSTIQYNNIWANLYIFIKVFKQLVQLHRINLHSSFVSHLGVKFSEKTHSVTNVSIHI